MTIVLLAAGAIAGLILGLFGAGGTIVALPLLLFGAGLTPHLSIGTNAIGVAAIALALLGWRISAGEIRLTEGLSFAVPGLVGIAAGAEVGLHFAGGRLVFLLGFVVFVVAAWMAYLADRVDPETSDPARRSRPEPRGSARSWHVRLARIGSTAVGVGAVAGFFGVGGGFLIVPGLAWAADIDLREAARSGLVPIAGFASLIGLEYLASGSADVADATLMVIGGLVGGASGVWLGHRVPRRMFQQAFAGFLVLIGILMISH